MNLLQDKTASEITSLLEAALRKEVYGENWEVTDLAWNVWVCAFYPFDNRVVYGFDQLYYERSYIIDPESLEVTLDAEKTEVQRVEDWQPVTMSFSEDAEEGCAFLEGNIFEAGDYRATHGPLAIFTEADVRTIAEATKTAPLRIEHNSNPILDEILNKFGIIAVKSVGSKIWARVKVPQWLKDAFDAEGIPFKVSIGLDGTLRRIKELSICKWPRVDSAEIFGQQLVEAMAKFSKPDPNPDPSPTPKPPTFGNPNKTMNLEALKLLFSKSDPNTLTELGLSADQIDKLEVKTPKVEMPPQFTAMQNGFVTSKAEAFFSELAVPDTNGVVHATNGMKPHIVTMYRAALKADGENGEVKFAADSGSPVEGDNVKALRSLLGEFSISTRQGVPAFSAKDSEGNDIDPLKVTKEGVREALGVRK